MSKLLHADFARLVRDKIFWFCTFFMFILGIAMPLMHYNLMLKDGYPMYMEDAFFIGAAFIGILLSVFCSMFLGTEYNDGTIRNKIIAGQKRPVIYLANLITCTAAGLFMCLACFIPYLCIGIPLLGFFTVEITTVLLFVLCMFFLTVAFSSIFTIFAMLNQNKASTAVACILSAFLLLFAGSYINAQLRETQMYESYAYVTEAGEIIIEEAEPNPHYVGGLKRIIYKFLNDFLPGGQSLQIANMSAQSQWLLMLYSGIIIAGTTGAGICFFRKKDLK